MINNEIKDYIDKWMLAKKEVERTMSVKLEGMDKQTFKLIEDAVISGTIKAKLIMFMIKTIIFGIGIIILLQNKEIFMSLFL